MSDIIRGKQIKDNGFQNIIDCFNQLVLTAPDALAVVQDEKQFSYKDLDLLSQNVGGWLYSLGVRPGDIVPIISGKIPEYIYMILGILKCGAAYAPIDSEYPDQRIIRIIEYTKAKIILADTACYQRIKCLFREKSKVLPFRSSENKVEYELPAGICNHINSGTPAYVIFTSGTSGIPKGVVASHGNVTEMVRNLPVHFSIDNSQRVAQVNSFAFDASVAETWGALLSGAPQFIFPSLKSITPVQIVELIAKYNITFIGLTPTAMKLILTGAKEKKLSLETIKTVLLGGEALDWKLVKEIHEIVGEQVQLFNIYGPTETTGFSSLMKIDPEMIGHSKGTVPIGVPAINEWIVIEDKNGNRCNANEEGEIIIGGSGVTLGYLNDQKETMKSFKKYLNSFEESVVYHSGDIGWYDENGIIHFKGRLTEQVKIRGFRIELQEIENAINSHSSVSNSAVIFKKNNNGNFVLAAYYSVDDKKVLDEGELRKYLKKILPEHMIPNFLVKTKCLPLNSSGKVDKKQLTIPEVNPENTGGLHSLLEKDIAEVYCEVMGLKRIGRNANFFFMGGDSISALHLVGGLIKKGYDVKISDILRFPVIKDLAGAIKKKANSFASKKEYVSYSLIEKNEQSFIPKDAVDAFPLTPMQNAIYAGTKKETASPTYHIQASFWIEQPFEHKLFVTAMENAVERFDQLRTIIRITESGRPLQVVMKNVPVSCVVYDCTGEDTEKFNEIVDDYKKKDLSIPIDLERGSLYRITVFKNCNSRFLLVLTIHHLIHDGWSLAILMSHLQSVYAKLLFGNYDLSIMKKIPFAKYVEFLYSYLKDEQHCNFWRSKIRKISPTPLPKDMSEIGSIDESAKFNYSMDIDNELVNRVNLFCRNHIISSHSYYLSVYLHLMHILLNEREISIGVVTSGRSASFEDYDKIFGCCINTLPLSIRFRDKHKVKDFIDEVHAQTLELMDHCSFPLSEILKMRPSEDHGPLFNSIFNYENYSNVLGSDMPRPKFSGSVELTEYPIAWSVFDGDSLSVRVSWIPEQICFNTVKRWCGYYVNLISSMLDNSEGLLTDCTFLPSEEKALLESDWNRDFKKLPEPISIHQCIVDICRKKADSIAVKIGNESITFGQLEQWSAQIAIKLLKNGVSSGSRIAVMLDRSTSMIAAIIGILRTGASYVPMDASAPMDRILFMINDCQASKILTNREIIDNEKIKSMIIKVDCLDENNICQHEDCKNKPEDEAYIIYTSGTTGTPKGVMVSHSNVINMVYAFQEALRMDHTDRIAQFAPLTFDASAGEIFITLMSGNKLVILPSEVINNFREMENYLNDNGVTLVALSPHYLKNLDPSRLKTVKKVMSAGSAIGAELAAKWVQKVYLVNGYGPTETTIISTTCSVDSEKISLGIVPIGRPVANTQTYVVGTTGHILPIGAIGELFIGGYGVSKGYVNNSELTAQKFRKFKNNWVYRTGDLVTKMADGNLLFCGRTDNQVKIRGYRIEIEEIESHLCAIPGVREGCVDVNRNDQQESYLTAYYVTEENTEISAEDIRVNLIKKLPMYMVPSYLMAVDKIPLTVNGKIDKKKLPDPKIETCKNATRYIAPRNEIEKNLVNVFEEVLQVKNIGIDDNYFHLGGDSVKSIQICSRLHSLEIGLNVKDIMECQNIRIISHRVKKLTSNLENYNNSYAECQNSEWMSDDELDIIRQELLDAKEKKILL